MSQKCSVVLLVSSLCRSEKGAGTVLLGSPCAELTALRLAFKQEWERGLGDFVI